MNKFSVLWANEKSQRQISECFLMMSWQIETAPGTWHR